MKKIREEFDVMALIKCNDCGKEISDKAPNCIHCGCPIEVVESFLFKIDYKVSGKSGSADIYNNKVVIKHNRNILLGYAEVNKTIYFKDIISIDFIEPQAMCFGHILFKTADLDSNPQNQLRNSLLFGKNDIALFKNYYNELMKIYHK